MPRKNDNGPHELKRNNPRGKLPRSWMYFISIIHQENTIANMHIHEMEIFREQGMRCTAQQYNKSNLAIKHTTSSRCQFLAVNCRQRVYAFQGNKYIYICPKKKSFCGKHTPYQIQIWCTASYLLFFQNIPIRPDPLLYNLLVFLPFFLSPRDRMSWWKTCLLRKTASR